MTKAERARLVEEFVKMNDVRCVRSDVGTPEWEARVANLPPLTARDFRGWSGNISVNRHPRGWKMK